MRSYLILLAVLGFVAFATAHPLSEEDSHSVDSEELDINNLENYNEILEEERKERAVDSNSSSSEESDEVKKPADPLPKVEVEEPIQSAAARRRRAVVQTPNDSSPESDEEVKVKAGKTAASSESVESDEV